MFSFFDAFTLICPLTIHNVESVSILISFSLFTFPADPMPCWTYAGHVIIRGAYNDIDVLARLQFLWAVIQAKDLILSDLVDEGPMRT